MAQDINPSSITTKNRVGMLPDVDEAIPAEWGQDVGEYLGYLDVGITSKPRIIFGVKSIAFGASSTTTETIISLSSDKAAMCEFTSFASATYMIFLTPASPFSVADAGDNFVVYADDADRTTSQFKVKVVVATGSVALNASYDYYWIAIGA